VAANYCQRVIELLLDIELLIVLLSPLRWSSHSFTWHPVPRATTISETR
jgi:hypothetical protein